jgi:hypothetical protein
MSEKRRAGTLWGGMMSTEHLSDETLRAMLDDALRAVWGAGELLGERHRELRAAIVKFSLATKREAAAKQNLPEVERRIFERPVE